MHALTDTRPSPAEMHPTPQRMMTMIARNLLPEQILTPHSHPWGQVTYAPAGVVQVIAGEQTWFVPPMRAIWIPANVVHSVRVMETARLRALYIYPDKVPFSHSQCLVLEVSPLLRELVMQMEKIDAPGPREDHISAVILDELRHAEMLPMHVAMPQEKRLKALCEMLLANPASELTLEDFAKQVGASSRTLARLFEQDLGVSFGLWRQHLRLARAVPLISKGLPLSQVALELGYSSQSAFSAMFKKTMGKSPSHFFGLQAKKN